ncbi:MAG: HD domain-containing protein [Clostridia bacterium]|nr:HD domain-containing protein [Clostridia bacterium]
MDKSLKEYILNSIKPIYKLFDKGHNISHFNFVTKNCINYAKQLIEKGENIDLDIAYIVGAFHDIGLKVEREGHAKHSAEIVRKDQVLKKYYNEETINMIAEAVEDHSSHLSYEPRSIYGKIVADADRNNSVYLVFSRPIKYGIKNEPKEWTKQQHIERVYEFVNNKFGRNGYVKYHLDIPDTTKEQQKVWSLLDNKEKCMAYIEGLFDEITKGKF